MGQLRVTLPRGADILTELLRTVRYHGGDVLAHLMYELQEQLVILIVCERIRELKLALEGAGLKPELQSVVMVQTENRWGALSHIVKVLADAGIRIGYSQATSAGDRVCIVLSTDDNGRAEQHLQDYLVVTSDQADEPEASPGVLTGIKSVPGATSAPPESNTTT